MRFKMLHLFFGTIKEFNEDSPPKWLVSNTFKWWWEGYVLKLKVGENIESDFWRFDRIS